MAWINATGFELNSSTANVEINVIGTAGQSIVSAVTNGAPRTGTYAAKIASMTSATPAGYLHKYNGTAQNAGYLSVYLYVHTRPSADNMIAYLSANSTLGSTPRASLKLASDGTLKLFDNAGSQVGSASSALTVDTWYHVELKSDATAASGSRVIEARLAESVFATTSAGTQSTIFAWAVGGNLASEAQTQGEWYFDDLVLKDDGYPGAGKLGIMRPDSAGDANTFATQTGGSAGAGNNFGRVNETTPDDATSFNGSSTLNEEDLFNMGASGTASGDTINVVFGGGRFRNSTADTTAAFKFEIMKTTGGTKSQSAAIVPNTTSWNTNATNVPRNYQIISTTDPDGAAWTGGTSGTLDSMQFGYKLTTAPGTAGRRIDVTAVWVYFYYTPSAGGSSIKTINGLAKASVKTVNGLAIASVKTWNGLA